MDTILVIEDEKEIAELVGVFLEQAGYRVVQAYDGLEGIRLYEKEHPDLVILDVLLPKLDGFSVCRALRQKDRKSVV